MNTAHHDRFEQEWREAFHGATSTPSPDLWSRIEQDLDSPEGSRFDKRLLLLYWTVAASVAFAFFAGSISLYMGSSAVNDIQAASISYYMEVLPSLDGRSDNKRSADFPDQTAQNHHIQKEPAIQNENNPLNIDFPSNNRVKRKSLVLPFISWDKTGEIFTLNHDSFLPHGEEIPEAGLLASEPFLTHLSKVGIQGMDYPAGRNHVFMEKVFEYHPVLIEEDEEGKQGFWAGLTMGGGALGQTTHKAQINMASAEYTKASDGLNQQILFNKNNTRASSQGVGIVAGKPISNNLVWMGGIQFSSMTSGIYQGNDSNMQGKDGAFISSNLSSENYEQQGYYQEDRFNFVSIPARMGWKILKRKLEIAFYSGVETKIFVGSSTKEYSSGETVYAYQERKVRPVSLWAGVSPEISYNFSGNYRVSISPGYKIALTEFEKGSGDRPVLTDLAVALKYVFE